jgi:hypothetical protein
MMTERITSGQRDGLVAVVAAAARKAIEAANLDKEAAQLVVHKGGELAVEIDRAVHSALARLAVSQDFASEQVASRYGYLSGYKPRPVAEQLATLRQLFPELGTASETIASGEVPQGAEGWFAIPDWRKLAPTYGEAVEKVLVALAKTRGGKFVNYRAGELGPDRLRQSAKSVAAFQKLEGEQKGHDVLVVAAQFGLRHRGRSIRRARAVMGGGEFGLGAFTLGIMLLTHPDRLQHQDDLWIDCAGDEYAPEAGGHFVSAPFFHFYGGKLEFAANHVDVAHVCYGSASGFSPQ